MVVPSYPRLDELWADEALRGIDARARGKDHIGVIIELHLRLENTLVEILSARLAHPKELSIDDLNFHTKARIAAACGYISNAKALLYINTIRNKVAHNLHYRLTVDVADHLEKLISGEAPEEQARSFPPLKRSISAASMIGGMMVGRTIGFLEVEREKGHGASLCRDVS
jgi:hypothetical protein